jgi:cysteine-rich repeat protein
MRNKTLSGLIAAILVFNVALFGFQPSALAEELAPPSAPSGLVFGTLTSTAIDFTWTASTDDSGLFNNPKYYIERAPDVSGAPGTYAQVGTSNAESYHDTGLTLGTKYHYRVRARDAVLNYSDYSGATNVDLAEYANDAAAQAAYVSDGSFSATGGNNITYDGGYTIRRFTGNGNFVVTGSGTVDYLIVGGGGAGGGRNNFASQGSGGGGGGGVRYTTGHSVSTQSYPVVVGNGGVAHSEWGNFNGASGVASSAFGTSASGGGGGGYSGTGAGGGAGSSGGSGGGGGMKSSAGGSGTSGQGNSGYAAGSTYTGDTGGGGGGGGAGSAGSNSSGGNGISHSITGTAVTYGGGGGGGRSTITTGGSGGGGAGGYSAGGGVSGTNYLGGGGGGGISGNINYFAGSGGKGVVIIRHLTDASALQSYAEGTVKTQGSYALKGVANTTANGKKLTRTIPSPLNLSGASAVTFDIRSTRTGSNIKIGLRDSGGTTTEITPSIVSADTYQSVTLNLSGVSDSNKDNIDQIIVTIMNASSANTFYIDNMVAQGGDNATTLSAYCGDDIIQAGNGEQCDDGNGLSGDGCSSSCQEESGWTCVSGRCVKSSFSIPLGSTNLAAVADLTAVPALKLATAEASVQWAAPVNASGQNLDQRIVIGDGFVSVDAANLDASLNSEATVSVRVASCANWTVYHSTVPVASLEELKSLGALVGSGSYGTGSCSSYCTSPVCSGNRLTYTVPGFDGTGGEGTQYVGVPVNLGIDNSPPAFTAGPTDSGSDGTNPTNTGSDVTFTATASDPNADDYYVAFCKTAAITPNAGAAPTCDGGSWGSVSAATSSGNAITPIAYAVTGSETCDNSDNESCLWYAYACDGNGAGGSGDPDHQCSAVSNSESPFNANHTPTFGTVLVGSAAGGTGNIVPGSTVYFHLNANGGANGIDDNDSDTAQDNVRAYICDATSTGVDLGTNLCTGGSAITICAQSVPFDPNTVDFECSNASLASIPKAHATYDFKIFVYDSHGFAGTGTNLQSYDIQDVPPTVGTYTVNDISPVAGGSVVTSFSVLVSDDNGWDDIMTVDGLIYDDNTVNLSSGTCSADEKNCYLRANCAKSQNNNTQITATCDAITTWFNINPTGPGAWKAHANAIDQTGTVIGADSATEISVGSLSAVAVAQGAIAYGSITVGGTSSSSETTTMQNVGNIVIDVGIHGTDMGDGNGHFIPLAQQRWATTAGFTYLTGDHPLVADPESVPGNANQGCANQSVQVRATHDSTATDQDLFWKLRIPPTQQSGSYSGSNTFTSIVDGLCTGTD